MTTAKHMSRKEWLVGGLVLLLAAAAVGALVVGVQVIGRVAPCEDELTGATNQIDPACGEPARREAEYDSSLEEGRLSAEEDDLRRGSVEPGRAEADGGVCSDDPSCGADDLRLLEDRGDEYWNDCHSPAMAEFRSWLQTTGQFEAVCPDVVSPERRHKATP